MKTISRKLSIRLADILKNIETEYSYQPDIVDRIPNNYFIWKWYIEWVWYIKTLTLEEVIELIWKDMCNMRLLYPNAWTWLIELQFEKENLKWNSLIEVFEKFLEYCLDNDLLRK